jgi:hydroxymethylglutaryl-CoA synthase
VIGIEKIGVYGGRMSLAIEALVRARGLDEDRYLSEYLLQERSVFAPFEDAVTMAANAAEIILADADRRSIALLLVATESAVDFGKPVSSWVQRLCGLPSAIRNLEVKHACYGLTGAIRLAEAFLARHPDPAVTALVIGADASRNHLGDPAEPICGGAATAVLLSRRAPLIVLSGLEQAGVWSRETPDTFRPTATAECGNNDLSLFSYLDALGGSLADFRTRSTEFHPETSTTYNVYHAPFPAMTFQAHRQVLKSFGSPTPAQIRASFNARVLPGLDFCRRIGTSYGSSVWIALSALMGKLEQPSTVSVFSYGSGCQSEYFLARLTPDERCAACLTAGLEARTPIDVGAYAAIETAHRDQAEAAELSPCGNELGRDLIKGAFHEPRDWVLERVSDHVRHYARVEELAS